MFKRREIVFLIIASIILACNSDKEEDQATVALQEQVSIKTDSLVNKILGDEEGLIRGFDLGIPISKVKELENLEQFSETENELGYTFETKEDELVDIYYLYDYSQFLEEVQVDIYLNDDSTSSNVLEALTKYFTLKYGSPVSHNPEIWKASKTDRVKVSQIKQKIDRGLQINFYMED